MRLRITRYGIPTRVDILPIWTTQTLHSWLTISMILRILLTYFLKLPPIGSTSGFSAYALLEAIEGSVKFSSFRANFCKLALTSVLKDLIRVAGPAALIGGFLLTQIVSDLRTIARKVRDFSKGGAGIAIAIGGGQIAFLDQANGNLDVWTPTGLNAGFRRHLLLSNIPSSWRHDAQPVGDPHGYRDYHFAKDERWIDWGP